MDAALACWRLAGRYRLSRLQTIELIVTNRCSIVPCSRISAAPVSMTDRVVMRNQALNFDT
ncbi:hypothetical protein A1355_13315 [Methylomonas koyamae]|uniref:Uncharacterized protein n=1 Tax=Methylomonas koyamae TaxID=702114 RepID=A0A177N7K4_9GAMM|nr:hypothetical protein A1355_13315 [Methylomonas koyamae]